MSIFNIIDSKEKAYWHGYISADGYILKNFKKTSGIGIGIEISKKDEILIDNLINFLTPINYTKFYRTRKKNYKSKKEFYDYVGIRINSKELCDDYLKHINWQNGNSKADRLTLPDFHSKKLNLAWLLGYYDGDGSENKPRLASCSKKLLEQIKNKYNLQKEISKPTKMNTYVLYLGEYLRELMCKNYEKSLQRKRILIKNRKFRGTNKNLDFLTKEILQNLVLTHSLSEIGKMFNVSRQSIFKKIKGFNIKIPLKKCGRKKEFYSLIKKQCKFFPCHNNLESCQMCYCLLYFNDECNGNFKILENGIKDCSNCILPHSQAGYEYIITKLQKKS